MATSPLRLQRPLVSPGPARRGGSASEGVREETPFPRSQCRTRSINVFARQYICFQPLIRAHRLCHQILEVMNICKKRGLQITPKSEFANSARPFPAIRPCRRNRRQYPGSAIKDGGEWRSWYPDVVENSLVLERRPQSGPRSISAARDCQSYCS